MLWILSTAQKTLQIVRQGLSPQPFRPSLLVTATNDFLVHHFAAASYLELKAAEQLLQVDAGCKIMQNLDEASAEQVLTIDN